MISMTSKWRLRSQLQLQPVRARLAHVISSYRNFSPQEYAIARWLLEHADAPSAAYLHQLDAAQVTGRCSCGCPTVSMVIPPGAPAADPRRHVLPSATGIVEGRRVTVMLLQREGYLTSLYLRDVDPLPRPYGLPRLESLGSYARYEHWHSAEITPGGARNTLLLADPVAIGR